MMLCFRHRGGTGFGTGIFLSLIGVLVYLIVTMFRKIRRLRLLNRRHMRFYQAEILELNLVGVPPELRQVPGGNLNANGHMKLRWTDDTGRVREENFPLSPKMYQIMLGKEMTTEIAVIRDPKIMHQYAKTEPLIYAPELRHEILSDPSAPLSGEMVLLAEERRNMIRNAKIWIAVGLLAAAALVGLVSKVLFTLWVRGRYIWETVTK